MGENCPECKESITEPDLEVGDLFDCANCGWELEVMNTNPLTVTYSDAIYDEDEDDDDEY